MNVKNLMQMLCLALVGCITPLTQQSVRAADPNFVQVPENLPTANEGHDRYDYKVYWAFPQQSVFVVNYYYDRVWNHSHEYDVREDAEHAAFEYNRREVDRHASVVEEFLPFIWFDWGTYDLRPEAVVEKCFIESLGFESRIQHTIGFTPKGA